MLLSNSLLSSLQWPHTASEVIQFAMMRKELSFKLLFVSQFFTLEVHECNNKRLWRSWRSTRPPRPPLLIGDSLGSICGIAILLANWRQFVSVCRRLDAGTRFVGIFATLDCNRNHATFLQYYMKLCWNRSINLKAFPCYYCHLIWAICKNEIKESFKLKSRILIFKK